MNRKHLAKCVQHGLIITEILRDNAPNDSTLRSDLWMAWIHLNEALEYLERG